MKAIVSIKDVVNEMDVTSEELSDGLKMPSKGIDLKRNGMVSDRRHLRRSL